MDTHGVTNVPGTLSALWSGPLPGGLRQNIRAALASADNSPHPPRIFFRADDIGAADARFCRMMHLFMTRRVPLCLAVVPAWLDGPAWEKMGQFEPAGPLWCWHQHGWSHANHEPEGKKCEFGESRDREAIRADLRQGRGRLTRLLGELFLPVFTPPWNRCSGATLEILAEEGFSAVSRFSNAKPSAAGIIPDLAVNVDLHTRREPDSRQCWEGLFNELAAAATGSRIGFMLHHQRMNDAAFVFLDILLAELRSRQACCWTFREMLEGQDGAPSP